MKGLKLLTVAPNLYLNLQQCIEQCLIYYCRAETLNEVEYENVYNPAV